ncbi:regucalcin (senescence marker protein-30) [Seminavis robusta]|uniref:Regucalcin n=1 Tax=Seminavis robusta TaxID=568900 RepID=A0A9N8H7C1_9STRA|nr:regucalcin (senescence marker protein-30) [Seminavis robusta]|eukprot:Sro65_g036690.1 regucalcin (senescence marker protein-30) (349) ;mRNA; r:50191-51237
MSSDDDNKKATCLVDWTAFVQGPAAANVTSVTSATATLLFDTQSLLGEGIVYDDAKQEVVWCDILGRKFHRLPLGSGTLETVELPKMLGSLGLLDSSSSKFDGSYLFAWEDGFQIYNPSTLTAMTEMSQGEDVNPEKLPTRLNDGRCDPTGRRYICGGYYGDREQFRMKVFNCHWKDDSHTTLVHEPIIDHVSVTNSLQFSPDGKTMYFADSPKQQIVAYDYNLQAPDTASLLSNERLLYKLELKGAVPDGSCVDADGYLWNATWWGGIQSSSVRRIDPNTGQVVFEVFMPDSTSRVSCCCFAGTNLDILFITTAAVEPDLVKEPHAGGLYAIKLAGVKGRLEHRFQV